MRPFIFATLCLTLLITSGCQEDAPQTPPPATELKSTQAAVETNGVKEQAQAEPAEKSEVPEKIPPRPPVFEDFQGEPKLSLFPRVGDYQPNPDGERHPYWKTFIEHLVKVTGVAEDQTSGSRGWVFRSINSIDSLGFFAPLAVEPNQSYQVSFKLSAELPVGASAGIGILEFNEFLWIGEQYTEETFKKHYRGSQEGKRLTGNPSGSQAFTFTTGPDSGMIHLILFREGTHDRNALMFDDIEIK